MTDAAPLKFDGTVLSCLLADGQNFRSRAVDALRLDFAGIVGDFHAGATRRSTSREPWYPRGTEIRNDRQVSIVAADELALAAAAMEVREIAPGWIGANLVLAGVADRLLPPGTRLLFASGAALTVEAENGPCRTAGAAVGEHYPERDGLDLLFPKTARHKRGLVASVERPGTIRTGEAFTARLPPQRIYAGA
ncbi:MAG: MOSC domain-containing protein [Bauldia sp.]